MQYETYEIAVFFRHRPNAKSERCTQTNCASDTEEGLLDQKRLYQRQRLSF